MLNYEYPPLGGGAANAMYYLLKELAKHTINIDVITSSPAQYFKQRFSKNITIYKLNVNKKSYSIQTFSETMLYSLKAFTKINQLLKNKYDLCHCWFSWPSGFFGYFHRKKFPYIIALRGSDVPGYNPKLKLLDELFFKSYSRIVWAAASAVVANSEALKKRANKLWEGNIQIIPNGVDTKTFKPIKRKTSSKFLAVGRLIKRKGFDILIRALPPSSGLTIVGEGPELKYFKNLSKGKKIRFVGRVEHNKLINYYNDADVFVLPSLSEGMSNAMLEAMACGLPIIMTNVGGSEIIKDNGIIVKKNSVKDLNKALKFSMNNPEKMLKMGRKSRELAKTMSWENIAKSYLELYKTVI